MIVKFLRPLKGELESALIPTFAARGLVAIGAIAFLVVLGRIYGAEGVGVFTLAQSLYLGAAMIGRFGMDNALMRIIGQDPDSSTSKAYLRFAIIRATLLSLLLSLIIYFSRNYLGIIFGSQNLPSMLPGFVLAIPPFTVAFIIGGAMKGLSKPVTACLLQNGSISLLATPILLSLNVFWPGEISNAGWAIALASWLVMAEGFRKARLWVNKQGVQANLDFLSLKKFKISSYDFFTMSLAGLMQSVLCVMLAGLFLDSRELGLFRVADRVAVLISFILLVLNTVLPPHFARLYRENDLKGLSSLARKGSMIGLLFVSPILFVCLFFPHRILALFGEGFIDAALYLRILAVAHAFNVIAGSVGFLLTMTDHQKIARNLALIFSTLSVVLFLVFTPVFGALGVSVALAITMVLQNCAALFYTWKKLGILVIPLFDK